MPRADCYVVIDVLRATTTIAVLFHRGLRRLRAVESVSKAREAREPGMLLLGEEGGLRPDGFDLGNSPVDASALDVRGREALHATSNGTIALCTTARLGVTIAGAMANLTAVTAFCGRYERVVMVCAGNGGGTRFSLEDFAVAAAIVQGLSASPGAALRDAAILASKTSELERLVLGSEHADVLRDLGLEADVRFASQRDSAPCVPRVTQYGEGWAVLEAATSA